MTVQELIYLLEKMDSQLTVVVTTGDEDYFADINAKQFFVERVSYGNRRQQLYTANNNGEEVVLIEAVK